MRQLYSRDQAQPRIWHVATRPCMFPGGRWLCFTDRVSEGLMGVGAIVRSPAVSQTVPYCHPFSIPHLLPFRHTKTPSPPFAALVCVHELSSLLSCVRYPLALVDSGNSPRLYRSA
eukprot:GGOE01002102.1.p3 GENE.GGOE01002102.1~~GGOE01002102.1.p3  ORF type:complete len:116 (-),score=1.42 GGOE01002102.1:1817-2164(-)